ncbi:MAG: hypothetical protein NVS9B10_03610 [Nevskia sp.]
MVYARPEGGDRTALQLPPGTTLREAIRRSGLLQRQAELDEAVISAGVFGRLRELDEPLADGDRVEIYRPLQADPKLARRQRVKLARRRRS